MSSFIFFKLLKELKKRRKTNKNFLIRLGQQRWRKLYKLRKKQVFLFKKDVVFSKVRIVRKILRNRLNVKLRFRGKLFKYTKKLRVKHRQIKKLLVSLFENRLKSYLFLAQIYDESKFLNYIKLKTEVNFIQFNVVNSLKIMGKKMYCYGFEAMPELENKNLNFFYNFLRNSLNLKEREDGDLMGKSVVNQVSFISISLPSKFSNYKLFLYKGSLIYYNMLNYIFKMKREVVSNFLKKLESVSLEAFQGSKTIEDTSFFFIKKKEKFLNNKIDVKKSTPLKRMKKYLVLNKLEGYGNLNELSDFLKTLKDKEDVVRSFNILQRRNGVYSLRFFRTKRYKYLNLLFKYKLKIRNVDNFFFMFYGKIRRYLGFFLKQGQVSNYNEFFKFKYGGNLFKLQFKIFIKIFKYINSSLNKASIKGISPALYLKSFTIFLYFFFFINRKKYFYNKTQVFQEIKTNYDTILNKQLKFNSLRNFKKFRRKSRKKKRTLIVWRMFSITSANFFSQKKLNDILFNFYNSNFFLLDHSDLFYKFLKRSSRLNFLSIFFKVKNRQELFFLQFIKNVFCFNIFDKGIRNLEISNLFYYRFF